jgi:hypothetical protein
MAILNVRLDPEDHRRAQVLKRAGVQLSGLVREAIRREYARRLPRSAEQSARALMDRIHSDHPDPADLPERDYDVHDRRAARRAIQRRLRQKRR